MRSALFTALTRLGHAVELAEDGERAKSLFSGQKFDLVVTELKLPRLDGISLLKEVKKLRPQVPVIVMSSGGAVEDAVSAMREGAQDFLIKPFPNEAILESLNRAFSLCQDDDTPQSPEPSPQERPIIAKSPMMQRLLALARSLAGSSATVLLQGESGTGKELLARFIHNNSSRSGGPFVAVNCAGLPESLLESELFGHEKGAFTGALNKKPGKFDLAHNGTLLLDEISEMDISLQAKLLRALQEGEIDPVGGKGPHKIDVRVIATTNRRLKNWVDEGRFRPDLYYRLNVMPFYIPALKERAEDIPVLAEYFREKYAAQNHKNVTGFSPGALEILSSHSWPGNIRELENTVARAVLMAQGQTVDSYDIFMDETGFMAALERNADGLTREKPAPDETQSPGNNLVSEWALPEPSDEDGESISLSSGPGGPKDSSAQAPELPIMTINEMERKLIGQVLSETAGNRTKAAYLLGISVRTLRNKLNEYREQGEHLAAMGS
jgi:two-component system response regulator FlrC